MMNTRMLTIKPEKHLIQEEIVSAVYEKRLFVNSWVKPKRLNANHCVKP